MKLLKLKFYQSTGIILTALLLSSFAKTDSSEDQNDGQLYPEITKMADVTASSDFNRSLSGEVQFYIQTLDNDNKPISGVRVDNYKVTSDLERLHFSGITNYNGDFCTRHPLPPHVKEVVKRNNYVGFANEAITPIEAKWVKYRFGGKAVKNKSTDQRVQNYNSVYKYIGTYNSQGAPKQWI